MTDADWLREIRTEYARSLPQKRERIEGLVTGLEKARSEKALKELREAIHRIYGTAGSYGFAELAGACRDWDLMIAAFEAERRPVDDGLLSRTRDALERFRSAISCEGT